MADAPRIPRRRSSFSQSTHRQLHDQSGIDDAPREDDDNRRERRSRQGLTSNTWTSSSGDVSEDSEGEDRTPFVLEYNRLAKKYGILAIVPDEFVAISVDKVTVSAKQGSWIMRKLLRRTSSVHASRPKTEKHVRHKRSISDISLRMKLQKDSLKDKDLVELIRLCGASALYLPAEYAAGTLAVPTCFRATAQYLVQHAATSRGIFRIPGSHSTINALYNHYASQEDDGEVISDTVRCPTLPEHIKCNVHDVASAFKKFLSGLPGGILGKVWLFDAFVSIHSQLDAAAEVMRTKQSKVRARLIALAIATMSPRYQRELICAVLGLLSMIGRAAETAPREDEHGRPLPTSDLMGYGALGIVFGPLLIGTLIDGHDLCPAGVHGSLIFVQRSPPKSTKGKHKKNKSADESVNLMQGAEKIRIVNSITEMLITHWRDVIRHMKNLNALRSKKQFHSLAQGMSESLLRHPAVQSFSIRRPKDWDAGQNSGRHGDRGRSPTPNSRNDAASHPPNQRESRDNTQDETLSIMRLRPRPRPMSSQILSTAKSVSILTPTKEESQVDDSVNRNLPDEHDEPSQRSSDSQERIGLRPSYSAQTFHTARSEPFEKASHRVSNRAEAFVSSSTPESSFVRIDSRTALSAAKPSRHSFIHSHSDENPASTPFLSQQSQVLGEVFTKNSNADSGTIFRDALADRTLNLDAERTEVNGLPGLPRRTHSPQKASENCLDKLKPSSSVPLGIVSGRLRAIAAVDSGTESSSEYIATVRSDYQPSPVKRILNSNKASLQSFESFTRDPLARVSQEEDLASLVSLAEAIQSQEKASCKDAPGNAKQVQEGETASNENLLTKTPPLSLHSSLKNTPKQELTLKVATDKIMDSKLTAETSSVNSVITNKIVATPQQSAFDLSDVERSGSSSVKALAARFNAASMERGGSPLPISTPERRRTPGSPFQTTILSPYTVNHSPVPRSSSRNRSDTSVKTIRYPLPVKRYTIVSPAKLQATQMPLLTKSTLITDHRQDKVEPPKWPQLRPVARSFPYQSESVRKRESSASPVHIVSNLHRTGDGNMSSTISRKSSMGTVLPRPANPPIAHYIDFARPPSDCRNHFSSPIKALSPSPSHACGLRELSGMSFSGQRLSNQGSSMLYSQIQDLQKQLVLKGRETDNLRRQLVTKDSLCDLGTLSEQLRQANRDVGLWRSRAEIAEKRLESLSSISQKDRNDECGADWTVTQKCSEMGMSRTTRDSFSIDLSRKILHQAAINFEVLEKEGTV